jgi:hypothetical protein
MSALRAVWAWIRRRARRAGDRPSRDPDAVVIHLGQRYVRDDSGWRRVREGDLERWREEGLL